MHEPAVPRSRPRWRRLWAVVAVGFAISTMVAIALVPGGLREHEAFVARAVEVDATITDRDCTVGYPSSICVNRVRYRFDGRDHLVERNRWDRPVGDRLQIAVDPENPERFEVADMGGGEGTLWTVIAFVLLTGAVLAVTSAAARRETIEHGSSVVFHRVPSRWAAVPLGAAVMATAGAMAVGVAGWSDVTGVVVTVVAAVVGAVGVFAWQLRRPDRLVLAGGVLTAQDRSDRVVRTVDLGPGTTWEPTSQVRLTGVRFRDADGRFTVSGHSWGMAATEVVRRLVVTAEHHGTVRAPA